MTQKHRIPGTHRAIPPSETYARVKPLLREFGITRVAPITGLDDIGIPVVLAVRPNSRSLSVSQGKGVDLDSARVSAVMESIEHFHAERILAPLFLGSYRELAREHSMVDVSRLPRHLSPFDPAAPTLWIEATELERGATQLVPFARVHVNLTRPLPPGSFFFPIGSNGLASGNSRPEAIVHALCELIERDAMALFYRRSAQEQAQRRLVLESVDDEGARELLSKFHAAGVRVVVHDVTSDLDVAAFYAQIIEDRLDPFRRVGKAAGFGCHLHRGVALCRALTEAAQSRLTRISGSRDDIQRRDFDEIRSAEAIARQHAALDAAAPAQRAFGAAPTHDFSSFEQDVAFLRARVLACQLGDPLFVDLTRPGVPFSVVRVLVPGLEESPDLPGYVPGSRALSLDAAGRA